MARRRTPRSFVRPAPRSNVWFGFSNLGTTIGGASKVLIGSLNAAALALRPFTIIRTRMTLLIRSDQVGSSESPQGAFGMIVAKEQAVAAGAASLPGPGTDTDAQFFVHEPWIVNFTLLTAAGFEGSEGVMITVDSKAMRKVGPNEDIITISENLASAAIGAVHRHQGRMLVKLH